MGKNYEKCVRNYGKFENIFRNCEKFGNQPKPPLKKENYFEDSKKTVNF